MYHGHPIFDVDYYSWENCRGNVLCLSLWAYNMVWSSISSSILVSKICFQTLHIWPSALLIVFFHVVFARIEQYWNGTYSFVIQNFLQNPKNCYICVFVVTNVRIYEQFFNEAFFQDIYLFITKLNTLEKQYHHSSKQKSKFGTKIFHPLDFTVLKQRDPKKWKK